MKLLLLMSSLRSGSHMVRSMLRDDPTIRDVGMEHAPPSAADIEAASPQEQAILFPLKYGQFGFTGDCIGLAATPHACALILHRRDAEAQARSLAHARKFGSWIERVSVEEPVQVTTAEVDLQRRRNERDLAAIIAAMRIPHEVLAYEDISTASVAAALSPSYSH